MFGLGNKKRTALEVAMADKSADINPRIVLMSIGIGLMLGVAGLAALQAVAVWMENQAEADLLVRRDQVANRMGKLVTQSQLALQNALADESFRAALSDPDPTINASAVEKLTQALPQLNYAEFFAADLPQLVASDLAAFGYAKADILAEARERKGAARVQSQKCIGVPGDCMALAQPIRQGEDIIAFAYVLLPLEPIIAEMGNEVTGGMLELRQGSAKGLDWVLKHIGSSESEDHSAQESSVAIAESHFLLASKRASVFKPGLIFPVLDIRSIGNLLTIVLSSLIGALALLYERLFPNGLVAKKTTGNIEDPLVAIAMPTTATPRKNSGVVNAPTDREKHETHSMPTTLSATVPSISSKPASGSGAAAIERSIFRAYDIRGIVGKTLTPAATMLIGQAIGTAARQRGLSQICVARDGRHSGPQLAQALIGGLRAAGCDVIDIGMVPTPVLYFSAFYLNTGSGVMVTGSHNPPDYNGFKIVLGGETLAEDAIQELFNRIVEGNLMYGMGGLQTVDVADDYVERIVSDVQTGRRMKVVVDCGNGVAGVIAPRVLAGIGCEVEPLFCDIDGDFPNHHPDPGDPHNLVALKMAVKQTGADIGLAFDGDGDRLGVVTRDGEIIYPDRVLMLFAQDVLSRKPGAAVIYDVKCTGHLSEIIVNAGGNPIMWKTGHSLIKAKMREEDAALAGEMSGHFFFSERWYGFDDGIYSAARLMEILALRQEAPEAVFARLPKGVSTPELKIEMAEGEHYAFMEKFRACAKFPDAQITTIDGVRADYKDGWGLVRCSNTTPSLVLRFDADSSESIERIQASFRQQLLAINANLILPF